MFGDVDYVGLRNMEGKKEEDYRLWSHEPFTDRYGRSRGGVVRAKFEEAGGRIIDMPPAEVGPPSVAGALGLSFAGAATYTGPSFQHYDRLNMASWLRQWVNEFRKIGDLLGFEGLEWRAF